MVSRYGIPPFVTTALPEGNRGSFHMHPSELYYDPMLSAVSVTSLIFGLKQTHQSVYHEIEGCCPAYRYRTETQSYMHMDLISEVNSSRANEQVKNLLYTQDKLFYPPSHPSNNVQTPLRSLIIQRIKPPLLTAIGPSEHAEFGPVVRKS